MKGKKSKILPAPLTDAGNEELQPDYAKIRRRIEDTLRKTADNETLLRIARELSVKID